MVNFDVARSKILLHLSAVLLIGAFIVPDNAKTKASRLADFIALPPDHHPFMDRII